MTLNFTGIIKNVFDYKQGVSQKTNQAWSNCKMLLEEQTDAKYKSAVVVELWNPLIISWVQKNVGQLVTIEFDPRVDEFRGKYYGRNRCLSCSYNGASVETFQPQPTQQPQTIYAKQVPPVQPTPTPQPQQEVYTVPEPDENDLPF